MALPASRATGTEGTPVALLTNHFVMTIPANLVVYHYDVDVTIHTVNVHESLTSAETGRRKYDALDSRETCYMFYKMLFDKYPQVFKRRFEVFYDGRKSLYSLSVLNLGENGRFTATFFNNAGEEATFVVSPCDPLEVLASDIMSGFAGRTIDFDRSALQIFDLLTNMRLNLNLGHEQYVQFGPFFYTSLNAATLAPGKQIYDGLFKSVRPVQGASVIPAQYILTMNIDTKKAPFYAGQSVIAVVCELLQLHEAPSHQLEVRDVMVLRHFLKGLKAKTIHTQHAFRIADVSQPWLTARTHRFALEDGREMSIMEYFQERYRHSLRYVDLPLLMKGKSFYPMELCEIRPFQKISISRLQAEDEATLIRSTAIAPFQRKQEIEKKFHSVFGGNEDPFLKAMSITVSDKMLQVSGRVLNNPEVVYQNKERVSVVRGQWSIKQKRFYLPATIHSWTVACFANSCDVNEQRLKEFIEQLSKTAANFGVKIENFTGVCDVPLKQVEKFFSYLSTSTATSYVLCVMPNRKDQSVRNLIKYNGEVRGGIVTQCVLARTVARANFTTYEQLVMKMNVKNGGVNNEVSPSHQLIEKWFGNGTMYVGLDVNHPPPMSKREIENGALPQDPSVVGLVANCGRSLSDYRLRYRLQDPRNEEISSAKMEETIVDFLGDYRTHRKCLPESIIVYRDGVSESQYKMVLETETSGIQRAFKHFPTYYPKLTVVVAQKRHHTRFFKQNIDPYANLADQNIAPGTVVDSGPVIPNLFDFFLCSHLGIQGTSRPTHYVVLYDDNNFTADTLQMLTYSLCCAYPKCTKSVSIPAPCYLAHHAATRGKELYCAVKNEMRGEAFDLTNSVNLESLEQRINMSADAYDRMIWA